MADDAGRSDLALAHWREVAVPLRETRTHFAESAQGVATDGRRWFVVSNRSVSGLMRQITNPIHALDRYRNTRRVGVYRLDGGKVTEIAPTQAIWAELVRRNRASGRTQEVHLGAPSWVDGTLLVPTQRPSGIWVLSDDLGTQNWWPDPEPVRPERFSWIDRSPANGLLYTSLHWHPSQLQALEWETLRRVPTADIALGEAQLPLDRVQGGAFTANGRVLLTSSCAGGQLFGYDATTGACEGVLEIGVHHELEGIAVRPVRVGLVVDGQEAEEAQVHVLSARTDYWPFVRWGDSFSIHSYAVPQPDSL
jgi:hypothetical protein